MEIYNSWHHISPEMRMVVILLWSLSIVNNNDKIIFIKKVIFFKVISGFQFGPSK